jgi:hypothetical protein
MCSETSTVRLGVRGASWEDMLSSLPARFSPVLFSLAAASSSGQAQCAAPFNQGRLGPQIDHQPFSVDTEPLASRMY